LWAGAAQIGSEQLDPTEAAAGLEIVLVARNHILTLVQSGEMGAQSSVVTVYQALDQLEHWPTEQG
jgi:hypothetical protein